MTLVIMAAGMGSRYGGIKQIDSMGPNGEIILDYSVYDALKAGFNRVLFVIRKEIEEPFRAVIGTRFNDQIRVDYTFQELDNIPKEFTVPEGRTKPWGTGHALLSCKNAIDEPFLVINADDFYGAQSFQKGAEGLKKLTLGTDSGFLVSYKLSNTLSPHGYVTRGVCQTSGDQLSTVTERFKIGREPSGEVVYMDEGERHSLSGDERVSMNFWGFSPAVFPMLEKRFVKFLRKNGKEDSSEYLIPSEIDTLISSGKLKMSVLQTDSSWFGVTYPEDKESVKESISKLIEGKEYPSPLWN